MGNNITIEASTDKGTTYRHYVSTKILTKVEERTPTWTTPGTYTWTVPEGATRLLVAVAGAGGRRCGSIWRSYFNRRYRRHKFNFGIYGSHRWNRWNHRLCKWKS